MTIEREKQLAAEAAAELVQDGMLVGLGTGSTVAYLLPALAARGLALRCVATSPATEQKARELGITVESFVGPEAPFRLDIAIDGADQVAPSGWLVKGGGGAHTREKAVAAAADRFVVIVSSDKIVDRLTPPYRSSSSSTGSPPRSGASKRSGCATSPRAPRVGSSPISSGHSTIRRDWPLGSRQLSEWWSTACSRRRWSRMSSSPGTRKCNSQP